MSSSINGLNSSSFNALTQRSAAEGQRGSRMHHRHHMHHDGNDRASNNQGTEATSSHGTGTQNTTTTGTDTQGTDANQRFLARAQRDVSHTLRGVARETGHLLDRIGSNTELADKVKTLASDFEQTLNDRYNAFVQGGGTNYMDFVEQTAAARHDFRRQLRDIARSLPSGDTTTTTDTAATASTSGTTSAANADSVEQGATTTAGTSSPGIDRAQRDLESLARGLDREAESFMSSFGNNADAVAKFNSMRSGFEESLKKEFDSLAQGNTPSYIDFAERVASMRQAFTRDVRSTFGSPAQTTTDPTTPGGSTATSNVGDDKAASNVPQATAGVTATASPLKANANDGAAGVTIDAPTTADESAGTSSQVVNSRNIERARHDAEVLLRGLDRDSSRLLNAMGDTPEARQVSAQADAFRSMLQDHLNSFVQGGGMDYMGFVERMASARQGLSTFFTQMGGPKIDRLG